MRPAIGKAAPTHLATQLSRHPDQPCSREAGNRRNASSESPKCGRANQAMKTFMADGATYPQARC